MSTLKSYTSIIQDEIGGLYGSQIIKEMNDIIKYYEFYEGKGQIWELPKAGLDYKPTQKLTNWTKKLIKEEARFLFGKCPEFIVESEKESNETGVEQAQTFLNVTLKRNKFAGKIIKGARDCFIGKRVAIKLSGGVGRPIQITFRPSLEFVFETEPDDADTLTKIIFFYALNEELKADNQRVWKQKYEMINGKCIMNEAIYDGMGNPVEIFHEDEDTLLDFIPATVVVNDGLSGDLSGESDVMELKDNQNYFNKLSSDDIDALRFNMFPQLVATDATEESLDGIVIAPAALIDLKTDPASSDNSGKQATLNKLETNFSYGDKLEDTLDRLKSEMYETLNIPMLSLDDLKGMITSGKSMRALYWQLITRCEEKWTSWGPALEWMAMAILKMAKAYKLAPLPEVEELLIKVENIYPLIEDTQEEMDLDMNQVNTQVMARKSYMKKWHGYNDEMADEELEQIQLEGQMLEDSYLNPEGDTGQSTFNSDEDDDING